MEDKLTKENPHHPYEIVFQTEHGVLVISVTNQQTQELWSLKIEKKFDHIHPDLEDANDALNFFNRALEGQAGNKIWIEIKKIDEKEYLQMVVKRKTDFGSTKECPLALKVVNQSETSLIKNQLCKVRKCVEEVSAYNYRGEFRFDAAKCHDTLSMFHNRTAVRKKGTGTTGPVAGVMSIKRYNQYVVYWEFRIVCAGTRSMIMFGATSGDSIDNYAGCNAKTYSGASLHGKNGYCYKDGSYTDYQLQPKQMKQGTYVGLLLDTKKYTIQFSINGESGVAVPLSGPHGDGYRVMVTLYDGEECVEIMPQFGKYL